MLHVEKLPIAVVVYEHILRVETFIAAALPPNNFFQDRIFVVVAIYVAAKRPVMALWDHWHAISSLRQLVHNGLQPGVVCAEGGNLIRHVTFCRAVMSCTIPT